jgi:hypothetical protein
MRDLRIVGIDKHGIVTTRQDFEVNGGVWHIINEGPFEIKKIGKFRMKIREIMGLKNPSRGIYYEP